jgi:hypothetical protein
MAPLPFCSRSSVSSGAGSLNLAAVSKAPTRASPACAFTGAVDASPAAVAETTPAAAVVRNVRRFECMSSPWASAMAAAAADVL